MLKLIIMCVVACLISNVFTWIFYTPLPKKMYRTKRWSRERYYSHRETMRNAWLGTNIIWILFAVWIVVSVG